MGIARIGRVRLLAVAALAVMPIAWADDHQSSATADLVIGLWAGPSSVMQIYSDSSGTLHGKVVALLNPLFKKGDAGPLGEPVTDIHNPDPALRAVPIIGMEILSDYQRKGKKWQGKIYDPESGKTYSSNMRVDKDGVLLMRGYIGAPMFGRTARFVPISRCTEKIVRMLRSAQLAGCS